MTREEAINHIRYGIIEENYHLPKELGIEACKMAIKALEHEPCDDAISRQAVDELSKELVFTTIDKADFLCNFWEGLQKLPNVTPQPRKGEWLRMSDLSEKEDDRYQCSRCRNVVHYKYKMDLYTFNSWCGRCGSDNGRKIEVLQIIDKYKSESENNV